MPYDPIESITEVSSTKKKPSAADFFHLVHSVEAEPFKGTVVSLQPEDFLRLVHEGSAKVFERIQRNFHLNREESIELHKICQRTLQKQQQHCERVERLRERVIQAL
jgi:hypothetical protein